MFIKVPLSDTLDDDHTLKNARSSCAKVVEAYDKGVVAAPVLPQARLKWTRSHPGTETWLATLYPHSLWISAH